MLILSDTDFIVLCIISFNAPVSGYKINQIARTEVFRFWTEIGQSSIYSRLKLLERKRLVAVAPSVKKFGKGPRPNQYSPTDLGKRTLDYRIIEFLGTPDTKKGRFDLGVFAIPLIENKPLICQTLQERIRSLHIKAEQLNQNFHKANFTSETPVSLNTDLLLKHALSQIKAEIDFSRQILEQFKE